MLLTEKILKTLFLRNKSEVSQGDMGSYICRMQMESWKGSWICHVFVDYCLYLWIVGVVLQKIWSFFCGRHKWMIPKWVGDFLKMMVAVVYIFGQTEWNSIGDKYEAK